MNLSAYIPCFNNEATLARVIGAIQRQTVQTDDLFVVDDGSTDRSVSIANRMGVRVVQHDRNLGRGAARATAMTEARGELVLGCDATVLLPERFVEKARSHFADANVSSVFGHFVERRTRTAVQRWRARHLYKQNLPRQVRRKASLITAGVIQRREHVLRVGNYNPRLRHSEDAELGARLLAAGYDVVDDPRLEFECLHDASLARLFERY
ncbi:MAG: glycosyltransferase family 2 protein, partial [Akkermansiaceae bacterium]|nr:glycosyltransferase family 2 protein [Verrucomicrobiales bacterium]